MHEPVLALLVLIGDVERPGEVLAVMMDAPELQAAPVRKKGVDAHGVVGPRELVPFGPAQQQVRKAQALHQVLQDDEVLLHLPLGVRLVHMAGVRFKEMDLTHPDERPGLLGLVAEGVHDLIDLEREVGVRAHP